MLEESVSTLSIWASMNSWFSPTVLFVLLNLMIGTILFRSNLSNPLQKQESYQQNDPKNPKILKSPSVLQRLKSNVNIKNFRYEEAFYLKQTVDSNPSQNLTQEFQVAVETQTSHVFEENSHQETLSSTETQFVFEQFNDEKVQTTQTHESEYLGTETHETQFEEINGDEYETEEEEEEEEEEVDGVRRDSDEVNSQFSDAKFISRTTSETKPASGEVPAKLPQKIKKSASMKSPFSHFEESDIVETRRPATVRERTKPKATEPDQEVDAKADDFITKFRQQLKLQRMDSILRYKEVISRGSIM